VYYFNTKLCFFEPVIEKVHLLIELEDSNYDNKNCIQKLEVSDVLNINFSVALYDIVFVIIDTWKQEKIDHDKVKETIYKNKEVRKGFKKVASREKLAVKSHLK
jgi:hypothetical protein